MRANKRARPSLRDQIAPYATSLIMLVVVIFFAIISVVGTAYMRVSRKADVTSCTTLFGYAAVTVVTDRFSLHGRNYDLADQPFRPSQTPVCMIPASTYTGPLSRGTYIDGANRAYSAVLVDDVGLIFSVNNAFIEASQTAASGGYGHDH